MTLQIEVLYHGPMDGLEIPDEDRDAVVFHIAPSNAPKMQLLEGSHFYRLEFVRTYPYGDRID